jgi:hypothetical protein
MRSCRIIFGIQVACIVGMADLSGIPLLLVLISCSLWRLTWRCMVIGLCIAVGRWCSCGSRQSFITRLSPLASGFLLVTSSKVSCERKIAIALFQSADGSVARSSVWTHSQLDKRMTTMSLSNDNLNNGLSYHIANQKANARGETGTFACSTELLKAVIECAKVYIPSSFARECFAPVVAFPNILRFKWHTAIHR